jgi:hypothetical protein
MKTPLFLQKEMLLVFIISLTTMMLARAQQGPEEVLNSHLTCFPGKHTEQFGQKTFNLKANEIQHEMKYSLKKCKALYKTIEFCVPSTKTRLDKSGIPDQHPKNAQTLTNDFICYIMKCNKNLNADQVPEVQKALDQFGLHKLKLKRNFNRMKVCVPAWKLTDDEQVIQIV